MAAIPAKGPGTLYVEHERADNGYGHPGGNFSTGATGQVVSKEWPERRLEAVKPFTNSHSRLKGSGTQ
jgi:hypothetical protein